jgi:catechol 2,3-dioxygenase-like lactoylglutathione lyase family enzyme
MLKGLDLVGVVVEDMARGVGIPGAKARIVFLQIPGLSPSIELIQYTSPIGKRTDLSSIGFGSTHVAFHVADIEQTHRDFNQQGVRFLSAPSAFPPDHPLLGGVKFYYFQDPDRALLELIQVPQ